MTEPSTARTSEPIANGGEVQRAENSGALARAALRVAAAWASVRSTTMVLVRGATGEPFASLILLVPALGALGIGAQLAGVRLWYEAQAPYNVDTPLYWTIGHGILKGFVPYRDLFETKPPGIFLLSALSYLLTGGGALTHVTQFVSIAFVALSPLAYLPRIVRARGNGAAAGGSSKLGLLVIFAALWALVLILTAYSATRADEVQVEAHGLAGIVGYMLLLGIPGRWAFRGRVLGLFVAIGMKEPFLLLVPAAYLVIEPRGRRAAEDFWAPLLVCGLSGAAFLLVVGWLPAYVGIYLRTMVGGHIQVSSSPWARTLTALDLTWNDVRQYCFILPTTLFFCAAVYAALPPLESEPPPQTGAALRIQALFLGALLGGLAVGMGGTFYSHHYVFLVPLYLAVIFALLARMAEGGDGRLWTRPGLVALALATGGLAAPAPPRDLLAKLSQIRRDDQAARESALVIDAVLDELHVDRYLYLGPGGFVPYPYTRHVPYGPMFFQQIEFFEGRYPWFVSEFRRRLDEAKIVVVAQHMTGPLDDEVRSKLERVFRPLPSKFVPKGKHCQYPILVRKVFLQ